MKGILFFVALALGSVGVARAAEVEILLKVPGKEDPIPVKIRPLAGGSAYLLEGPAGAVAVIPRKQGEGVLAAQAKYATPGVTYAMARSTSGYSAATAVSIYLIARKDASGHLELMLASEVANHGPLLPEYVDVNPPFVSVTYAVKDARREGGHAHARIELGRRGEVEYAGYTKPNVRVLELGENGLPNVLGEFPSVEKVLARVRQTPADVSEMRFAADFGPQHSGRAMQGAARANQLMPLIPIGMIEMPRSKQRMVVALPPDRLQAYKRGELPRNEMLIIPAQVLRFVGDRKHWQEIVDDYFDLRQSGRPNEIIFVANRRGGQGAATGQSMYAESMFDVEPKQDRVRLDDTLNGLRGNVPDSLLDWKRPKPSSGCGSDVEFFG